MGGFGLIEREKLTLIFMMLLKKERRVKFNKLYGAMDIFQM